jgi:hypothetical protein
MPGRRLFASADSSEEVMSASLARIKRTLRQLKQMEISIRFRDTPASAGHCLIWNAFFSTGNANAPVRYPMNRIQDMDQETRKEIFGEFFYQVYFQYFREHGLISSMIYDPGLLGFLGLPPWAGLPDIKRRFRELARKHHPDHGGDSERFIQLVDLYERLTEI